MMKIIGSILIIVGILLFFFSKILESKKGQMIIDKVDQDFLNLLSQFMLMIKVAAFIFISLGCILTCFIRH